MPQFKNFNCVSIKAEDEIMKSLEDVTGACSTHSFFNVQRNCHNFLTHQTPLKKWILTRLWIPIRPIYIATTGLL